MLRSMTALVAFFLLTGFAPAPFPRVQRGPDRLTLQSCQATWTVVRKESISDNAKSVYASGITHIRIQGDRWTLLSGDKELATYCIAIDGAKKPATIDWYPTVPTQGEQRTLWVGAIRRQGNELLVLYGNSRPQDRPVSFETPPSGWYLYTLRR